MDVHYLVASQEELKNYQDFYQKHQSQLADFEVFLRTHYALEELPQMMVLSNVVGATSVVRDITIRGLFSPLFPTTKGKCWRKVTYQSLTRYCQSN